MDKPGENASSDQILVGKDLRVQLTEGRHGSCLSTGADACVKVSVAMLSPPQKYMTGGYMTYGLSFSMILKQFHCHTSVLQGRNSTKPTQWM